MIPLPISQQSKQAFLSHGIEYRHSAKVVTYPTNMSWDSTHEENVRTQVWHGVGLYWKAVKHVELTMSMSVERARHARNQVTDDGTILWSNAERETTPQV